MSHKTIRLTLLLIALLLAFYTSAFPSARAQTVNIILGVDPLQVNPGDTFTLPIWINATIPIRGYQFSLSFDPSRLQVAGGSPSSVNDSGWMAASAGDEVSVFGIRPRIDNINGQILSAGWALLGGSGYGASGSGTLATVRFTVPVNALLGVASISLQDVEVNDVDGNRIPGVEIQMGSIQIGNSLSPLENQQSALTTLVNNYPVSLNIKALSIDFGSGPVSPTKENVMNGRYWLAYNTSLMYIK